MKKNNYELIAGIAAGVILTIGGIGVANQVNKNAVKSNKIKLCQGQVPNGEYIGKFEVEADRELSYYTEYLEIKNGKIMMFPTFNDQSLGMDFDIEADNIKIKCK
ncbi:MAG: hypothetical protein Q4D53_08510 [Leptotrichiaceae bacterium]|nr:hypothetical protein [Leptotrichiaceae bacterium]